MAALSMPFCSLYRTSVPHHASVGSCFKKSQTNAGNKHLALAVASLTIEDHLKLRVSSATPQTPINFLDRTATVYGDCPSIIYNSTTYTWSETHHRCVQLASSIASLIDTIRKPLQVVSVISPNVPAMYELHFAVPMSGAILNNINIRLDSSTVSTLLQHSESKLVFVDCQSASLVLDALSLFPPSVPRPKIVLITDEEYDRDLNSSLESPIAASHEYFIFNYEDLVKSGDPNFEWIRPKSEWDPIVLNYTSGTTSSPKGVLHSHRGSFFVTMNYLIDWSVPKQPVYLWTLPMFHANGWTFPWGMAAVGAVNICLRKFDAAAVFATIRRHKVTHMCGAPVILNMLSTIPDVQPLDHPVQILTAGAPPPASVLHRTESLGFVVTHGYGLTETGGGLTISCAWKQKWNHIPAMEKARLKARQGVPTIGLIEMNVIEPETGKSVARDGASIGEIVIRGDCLMLRYFKDPEATSKSMADDGWFKTGDAGVIHPDGYLEIKDRFKDVIISGGENISSVEVESVIYAHPAVNEAAVVARPDQYWGETPCAFVSLKNAEKIKMPTENEVIDYCRKKLPHYMSPKTVVFMEELPKTSTGKIQKFMLRKVAESMDPITTAKDERN